MKNKYKILLFDADNTLFDFNKAEFNSLKLTLEYSGMEFSEEIFRTYHDINESLWRMVEKNEIDRVKLKTERFRQLLEKIRSGSEKAFELGEAFIDNLSCQTELIDGAVDICRELSEDYSLYIITNGIARVQKKRFAESSLKEYIKDIFISEEIGLAKPDKAYFDYVIEHTGNHPLCDYLVIGDSLTSDIKGACSAGIDSCYYNFSGKAYDNIKECGATYNISKLSELYGILF